MEKSRPTILIIDDDQSILNLMTHAIGEDLRVLTANNGEQGLHLAVTEHPAVIVCDWMMPDINGLDICRIIKTNPSTDNIYFILLTAHGEMDNRVQALEWGADDFIPKPPNMKELRARLRAGLRIYELSWALRKRQNEMEWEINQAKEYLFSLLPAPLDFQHPAGFHIKLDWLFIPSAELGGDIFHYQWLDRDRLAIYLLDVAGHGIGAALLSVSILNLLASRSLGANMYRPAAALEALNKTFPMEKQNNLFFTIWYGVVDFEGEFIIYSTAGHPPAYFTNGATPGFRLKTKGIPIGMDKDRTYQERQIGWNRDARLVVYSDGIYDTIHNPTQSDVNDWLNRLEKTLTEETEIDGNDALEKILKTGIEINGSDHFPDDLSVINLSIRKTSGQTNT